MKLRSHVWNQLRSAEITEAQRAGAVVLVPFGAVEQHGPHLAVHTDIVIATAICLRAAKEATCPVLVATVGNIGFSPEHMALPGVISLRLETFIAVVIDVVESIWRHGFRRIMIVNGHGGNIRPLRSVASQLAGAGRTIAVCTYWETIADEQAVILTGPAKSIRHACEFETSMMLCLQPGDVAMETAVDSLSPPWNPNLPDDPLAAAGVFFPSVVRRSSPGLVGAPTYATPETGKKLVEVTSAKLARIIGRFQQAAIDEHCGTGSA